jgi:radical SAM protein with 4Fe4S-binding SPASM domain
MNMGIETLRDFLICSDRDPVVLSGGEPVLHPRFDAFLNVISQQGRAISFMTNAVYNPEYLRRVRFGGVRNVLINVSSEPMTEEKEEYLTENIAWLLRCKIHVTLGWTIVPGDSTPHLLYQLIAAHKIRAVRLSLMHPSERPLQWTCLEDLTAAAANLFCDMILELNRRDVRPTIDCGMPACIVNRDKYSEFKRRAFWLESCTTDLNLFPDGRLYHCHCSFADSYRLPDLKQAIQRAGRREEELRWSIGGMDRCKSCSFWKKGDCQGGCLGWKLRRQEMLPLRNEG